MQLRTSKSIKFFDEMFRRKFNFCKYVSTEKPTMFFGIYRDDDINMIKNHKGKRIIWFAGSDAMVSTTLLTLKELQNDENTVFVAESSWIAKDLDCVGIKYERISLFLDDIYNWKPVSLGDSLFFYNANTSKYGKEYLPIIKQNFPDINIVTNDVKTVSRDKMPEVYAQCFAGFRPIKHDGCSMSAVEMGLMGRYTIYNGDGPFSIKFNGVDDIISAIKKLRAGYNYRLTAKRTRMYFVENEAKYTNLVFHLCGLGEIDATNMFYEDKKRSGSIFRIQRKVDVDRIGGLGHSQMERPWFCQKMQELGKKQLIVSKNSGYNALEWKSIKGDKGYLKGVDFLTYDKRFC